MRCFCGVVDAAAAVRSALDDHAPSYDVSAIVRQLWEENGRSWDLSRFSEVRYWDIVDSHALQDALPQR